MKVKYDLSSFGVTQKCLKLLRDTLALWHDRPIAVVAVPADTLCCGFFVFRTNGDAVWTGDGFRMDMMGEGGAGMRSALGLLAIYGLNHIVWEEVNFWKTDRNELDDLINKTAEKIFKTLQSSDFKTPRKQKPHYIR